MGEDEDSMRILGQCWMIKVVAVAMLGWVGQQAVQASFAPIKWY